MVLFKKYWCYLGNDNHSVCQRVFPSFPWKAGEKDVVPGYASDEQKTTDDWISHEAWTSAWVSVGLALAPEAGHFAGSTAGCLCALRSAWLQAS